MQAAVARARDAALQVVGRATWKRTLRKKTSHAAVGGGSGGRVSDIDRDSDSDDDSDDDSNIEDGDGSGGGNHDSGGSGDVEG